MHISHTTSFNIPVSIALMINVYEICLNTINYLIFNMQDFRYCLWTWILGCFGQLVSPSYTSSRQSCELLLWQRWQEWNLMLIKLVTRVQCTFKDSIMKGWLRDYWLPIWTCINQFPEHYVLCRSLRTTGKVIS